jgi:hypothetical protein
VLAGVAGAAAAAHFTKHAVDRSDGDESEAAAEPAEEPASDEDEQEDGPEAESAEVAEDEGADEPEDESAEDPEDEQAGEPEDEEPEEPPDEETEEPEDEQAEEPQDEQAEEPEDSGEEEAEASDDSHSPNGSIGEKDEAVQLLARAREFAEEFTGHPVETFSGLAQDDRGWRIGMEVVEVSRVPSTTDVLASYEVILTGDGELVDFRRCGRYYRNAADGTSG